MLVTRVRTVVSLLCLHSLAAGAVGAQASRPNDSTTAPPVVRQYETRAQLQAMAKAAEKEHRSSEAWLLNYRLKNGDFQEGDRILFTLESGQIAQGNAQTAQGGRADRRGMDTLKVKSGKMVEFDQMPDLSLEGVLRSELSDTLRHHLSKYIKEPDFRATPLLPVVILGAVGTPGYVYTAADAVLRDVLTRARFTGQADLNKINIRRSGNVIWKPSDVRIALNDGMSVDGLHLVAGDEIEVGVKQRFGLSRVLPYVTTGMGLYLAYSQIKRGGRRR